MIFTDANQAPAAVIDCTIGKPETLFGGQGFRRLTGPLSINPLVGEVGDVDHSVLHVEGAAPVFMDSGSDTEWRGRYVGNLTGWLPANQDISALFGWSHFTPIEIVSIERNLAEPYYTLNDEVRGDRRPPAPKPGYHQEFSFSRA